MQQSCQSQLLFFRFSDHHLPLDFGLCLKSANVNYVAVLEGGLHGAEECRIPSG